MTTDAVKPTPAATVAARITPATVDVNAKIEAAMQTLERTARGRSVLRNLEVLLEEGGLGLDLYGQRSVCGLLECAFYHGKAGTVLDLVSTAAKKGAR